ncbi:MAG: radical SAM protein [Treponema sp.]|jgi:wyosine [tRNA(Phe)-imidazoG37] synthetase (radical SAM superfamily)|nr:radical SAM protein [Treponema sp.]
MEHLTLCEYRRQAYKPLTTLEYQCFIEKNYREFRNKIMSGASGIKPKRLGIHLANRDCSNKCLFCINGGTKHNELSLDSPEIFLDVLHRLLNIRNGEDDYIDEIHFDGDSSDPILPKTLNLFGRSIELIRTLEGQDGKNRLIQVITNGHFIHNLSDEVLQNIDLFNISINAYNRDIYEIYSGTRSFDLVLSNINKLCRFRDKFRSGQFVNASYVLSRIEARGLTNFSENSILRFIEDMNVIGVNGLKFRFDFNEKNEQYQEYIRNFIKAISDSGKFLPMNIHIQPPEHNPGFKYCLAPFIWPVLGPDIRLYPCPHSMKSELELSQDRESVFLIQEGEEKLCNCVCPPFMFSLNKIFNHDMEYDIEFRRAINAYQNSQYRGFSKTNRASFTIST